MTRASSIVGTSRRHGFQLTLERWPIPMGRPRRKSDAGHYLSPTPSDAWHADSPINIANSANTFFMNFCLRMLSVVATVSDFSLELQRAAYGYRADYYLGGVRGMRQVRKLRSRQVLALHLSRRSFPLGPFRHPLVAARRLVPNQVCSGRRSFDSSKPR